jgi:hypothetical protein
MIRDGGADARNVNVDRAVKCLGRLAAQDVHELLARQHAPGAFGQRKQQVELVRGQCARLAVDAHQPRAAVDGEPAEAQLVAGRLRAAPAQQGAHAGQQFARLERLRQVIVGADLQPDDAVERVALGGKHQDRQCGQRVVAGADAPAHLQAIGIGQHQVEDQQLRAAGVEPAQSALRVGRRFDFDAVVGQVVADHRRETDVVVDHQQPRHDRHSQCRRPARAGRSRKGRHTAGRIASRRPSGGGLVTVNRRGGGAACARQPWRAAPA